MKRVWMNGALNGVYALSVSMAMWFTPQAALAQATAASLVTEPAMAATVGSIIFVVVVVGGMGSLAGALLASILIGMLQTFAVALDWSLLGLLARAGFEIAPDAPTYRLLSLTLAEIAPILPYLLLVLVLIFRPKGLLGTRET